MEDCLQGSTTSKAIFLTLTKREKHTEVIRERKKLTVLPPKSGGLVRGWKLDKK